MTQLTITDIFIYPVKSLAGIRLDKAEVQGKGLRFDRRWMLIDDQGAAMTQREYPAMALFKVAINDDTLSIVYSRQGTIISTNGFSIKTSGDSESIKAKIWNDNVEVTEVDRAVSDWFSRHLKATCKLVSFPEANARPVDPKYQVHNEHVSLADAYPFLIIGQSSLDDLNARLAEAVPMNRFRPNFVFTGGDAFIEDTWNDISIGSVRFRGVKKCARCVLPTVNQDTAEKGVEPLRTLTAYRKVDNKVYFGQNLVALGKGVVAVGDPVVMQA